KLDYEKAGNESQMLRTEAEITRKKDYLTEYTNAKNVELESMLKSLENSDDFYKKLYDTLAKIAESGGYSMILSLQESNAILWYSNSVDITDQVISNLGL
ncbi:MAG: OmpH family outer membrane protein, partial [Treponema sp.]|nr:OmpH family outer membrane protein [Treponema sp.]